MLGLPGTLLVSECRAPIPPALRLHAGSQLVRLTEEAAASAVLRSFALVVRHEPRLVASPIGLPLSLSDGAARAHQGQRRSRGRVHHHRGAQRHEFVITRDTSWQAMLGKDEREASEEEIAALEAEHGPFQPADGEG